MAVIKSEEINRFLHLPVRIGIQDSEEEDKPPFIEKIINKAEVCPDGTHLRLYFNERNFLAVPLNAEVTESGYEWSAHDVRSGLTYIIRKGKLPNE